MFVLGETNFDVAIKRRKSQLEIQAGAGMKKGYLVSLSEVLNAAFDLMFALLLFLMIGIALFHVAFTFASICNKYGFNLFSDQHEIMKQDEPFIRRTGYFDYRTSTL